MIRILLLFATFGSDASAGGCRGFLEEAAESLRRNFNRRVIEAHARRSRESFARGFDATKRDLDVSRRLHEAVMMLDEARPGWDADRALDVIATAEAIPLIDRGVVPRMYPPHTVVLIEHATFRPLIAIRIDGERPDLIRLLH